MADPGYFSALQIPLLSGRFFTSEDRAGQPKTIIISHQLAQQYFPGENPLGKHLHVRSAAVTPITKSSGLSPTRCIRWVSQAGRPCTSPF